MHGLTALFTMTAKFAKTTKKRARNAVVCEMGLLAAVSGRSRRRPWPARDTREVRGSKHATTVLRASIRATLS
jgi:hypothetical protein